jgi:hypothetical protein
MTEKAAAITKWFFATALACVIGVGVTLLAFWLLLWGMPYAAGSFHHLVAGIGSVLLYPGGLFAAGNAALNANAALYAVATFLLFVWLHSRRRRGKTVV